MYAGISSIDSASLCEISMWSIHLIIYYHSGMMFDINDISDRKRHPKMLLIFQLPVSILCNVCLVGKCIIIIIINK